MRIGHAFEWKIDLLVIVIELNLKFNKLYKRAQEQAQHQAEVQAKAATRDFRLKTTTDAKRANCQFSDKQKPLTGLGMARLGASGRKRILTPSILFFIVQASAEMIFASTATATDPPATTSSTLSSLCRVSIAGSRWASTTRGSCD